MSPPRPPLGQGAEGRRRHRRLAVAAASAAAAAALVAVASARYAAAFALQAARPSAALAGSAPGVDAFGPAASRRLLARRQPATGPLRVYVGQPTFKPASGFDKHDIMGPRPAEDEAVPGLKIWLEKMGLEEQLPNANEWCNEMGAAVLEEVFEDIEGFSEALDLLDGEKETLAKRWKTAYSVLERTGELPTQKAVHYNTDYSDVKEQVGFHGRMLKREGSSSRAMAEPVKSIGLPKGIF
mmetsp:Transcript_45/g.99  ORF Transcript_45/g.99 Transcript_45/m.99 type:complete len:240 (+) Transcript_45:54-773(+)